MSAFGKMFAPLFENFKNKYNKIIFEDIGLE